MLICQLVFNIISNPISLFLPSGAAVCVKVLLTPVAPEYAAATVHVPVGAPLGTVQVRVYAPLLDVMADREYPSPDGGVTARATVFDAKGVEPCISVPAKVIGLPDSTEATDVVRVSVGGGGGGVTCFQTQTKMATRHPIRNTANQNMGSMVTTKCRGA